MRVINRLTALLVLFLPALIGAGRDIYVATNGDTVWISNGVYVLTNQVSIWSNLTICGISANDRPVVDGNNTVRCFSNAANTKVVLSNLFITRGYALGDGGGAYLRNATVRECVFSNNVCTNVGGGMILTASGSLHRCTFVNNKAYNSGGLSYYSGTGIIEHCLFYTNIAADIHGGFYGTLLGKVLITGCDFTCNVGSNGRGGARFYNSNNRTTNIITHCNFVSNISGQALYGGLMITGSNMWVTNCSICDNVTGTGAGGIYLDFGKLWNCLIARNRKTSGSDYTSAGGIYVANYAGPLIKDCIIEANQCGTDAGGVYINQGEMRNCLIRNNVAATRGGGIRVYSAAINNCTIVSNYAAGTGSDSGGGIFNGYRFENCVVYLNGSGNSAVSNYYIDPAAQISFSNCCLAPALAGNATNYSTNNITANPQFVSPASGDYRLTRESPCVNAGVNRAWMTGASDLEGRRRIDIFSGIADIGCYEYVPSGTMCTVK